MGREPYLPPRVIEPLQWEEVDSPPRYARTTSKAVQCAAVVDRGADPADLKDLASKS